MLTLVIIQHILNGNPDISHIRLYSKVLLSTSSVRRSGTSCQAGFGSDVRFLTPRGKIMWKMLNPIGKKIRKERKQVSKRSTPVCHSKSVEIMCLDTASFSVFGVILIKFLYCCL